MKGGYLQVSETLIGVVIGGILATIGGFIQSWYVTKNENMAYLRMKQEDAYLGYVDALLQLRENQMGVLQFKDYSHKYSIIKSKLKLYGSKSVLDKISKYEELLDECWECNGINVNNVISEIDKIIEIIRNELKVK